MSEIPTITDVTIRRSGAGLTVDGYNSQTQERLKFTGVFEVRQVDADGFFALTAGGGRIARIDVRG